MGSPEELEYQIELTGEILRLAVTFIKASNPNVKIPWPINLNDDCIKPTPRWVPNKLIFLTRRLGKDNNHTPWGSGIDDRKSVNFHQGHERNLCPCYRKGVNSGNKYMIIY